MPGEPGRLCRRQEHVPEAVKRDNIKNALQCVQTQHSPIRLSLQDSKITPIIARFSLEISRAVFIKGGRGGGGVILAPPPPYISERY